MSQKHRVRETIDQPLTAEYFDEKARQGWKPVAIEWERPAEDGEASMTEVPFGLRVGKDCHHLVEDAGEMAALRRMLALIVDDRSMSAIAADLNSHGLRQRRGAEWTQVAVFEMLPRVIEVAPDIYASEQWREERRLTADRKLRAVS